MANIICDNKNCKNKATHHRRPYSGFFSVENYWDIEYFCDKHKEEIERKQDESN